MKKIYITLFALCLSFLSKAQLMIHVGDKINSNIIVTAVDENETHFWVGTNKGVYKINKSDKKDAYYSISNSPLQSNYITAICCRKNGDVWIGTPKGIIRNDGYTFDEVDTENSKLPENYTTSMKEDNNGDLWIGTKNSGLVKVHNNRFLLYNQSNSTLENNTVRALNTDKEHNIIVSVSSSDSILVSSLVRK